MLSAVSRLAARRPLVALVVGEHDVAASHAFAARRLTDDTVVHVDESFRVYADPAGHPFCLIVQAAPDL